MSLSFFFDSVAFFLVGIFVAIPLLLLNIRVAPALGLIDWPKARGMAEEQIPIIGHALIVVVTLAIAVLMFLYDFGEWFLPTAIIMAVMGYFDDRKPLSAVDKLFLQILCSCAMMYLDPHLKSAILQRYGSEGAFWGVFFMVGLINAINFIDGIDGLAGMIIFIGSAAFVGFSFDYPAQYPLMVLASVLCGAILPFLYLNIFKRKGFLGNAGSYFFSYLLAVMHLSLPIESGGALSRMALSGLCFLVPIADAATVFLTRIFSGRSPFEADKGHLHHRLMQNQLPLRWILFNLGVLDGGTALLAILMVGNPGIRTSALPLVFCVAQIGLCSMLILLAHTASRLRVRAYFERLDGGDPVHYIKYKLSPNAGGTLTPLALRRLEAHVTTEIRVSDFCFTQAPDTLIVTIRANRGPLKGISNRIDAALQRENLTATAVVERGEFIKVASPDSDTVKIAG